MHTPETEGYSYHWYIWPEQQPSHCMMMISKSLQEKLLHCLHYHHCTATARQSQSSLQWQAFQKLLNETRWTLTTQHWRECLCHHGLLWFCDLDLWPPESNQVISRAGEYSLSVLSKLFTPFMRYFGNSVSTQKEEWMNVADGQPKNIMPLPTMSSGDSIMMPTFNQTSCHQRVKSCP